MFVVYAMSVRNKEPKWGTKISNIKSMFDMRFLPSAMTFK